MKTKEFLKKYETCIEGAKRALSIGEEMVDVWDAMIAQDKRDWLIWTATRPGVFPDTVLRKLACRFVRETPLSDGRKVWDLLTDERSRKAVEAAELYADGKATYEELQSACAAAYAAADAVARDAAHVASYAADAAAYAADAAADAAAHAAAAAAYVAAYVADAAAYDAARAAKAAQAQMIAELGNPFKVKGKGKGLEMSEQIDKSTQAWLKEIGADSPESELKSRISELEREVQDYKEENVKLTQQCLDLFRAVKKANCNLDAIEESCNNNVWFSRLKERTY